MKVLIVVDMQNDFIDGALGTAEAQAIVGNVVKKIENWDGLVFATRDTHGVDYLETQEGKNLPVIHCVEDTQGWEIAPAVEEALAKHDMVICFDKPTFGSVALMDAIAELSGVEEVELIGLCTDICVISNAMLVKAALPEVQVTVDAACCAGVTPASHLNALEAMKMCQIRVI